MKTIEQRAREERPKSARAEQQIYINVNVKVAVCVFNKQTVTHTRMQAGRQSSKPNRVSVVITTSFGSQQQQQQGVYGIASILAHELTI